MTNYYNVNTVTFGLIMAVLLLYYPPPGLFAPIFGVAFFIVGIMCIVELRIKLSIVDYLFFICFVLMGLVSLIFNFKIFFLNYVVSATMVFLIALKSRSFVVKKTDQKAMVLLTFSIFTLLFLYESHPIESRYSVVNGDPNYTSLFYFVVFYIISSISSRKLITATNYIVFIFVIYMTGSRMAQLMFFFYLLAKVPFMGTVTRSKIICKCIFLFSILAQPLLYFSADLVHSLRDFLPQYDQGAWRILNIMDSSNMIRIRAAGDAINFLSEAKNFLIGSSNYTSEAAVSHIPHHWFLLPAVTYGALFVVFYTLILYRSIDLMHREMILPVNIMFISGAILGSTPILLCLPFIMLFARSTRLTN